MQFFSLDYVLTLMPNGWTVVGAWDCHHLSRNMIGRAETVIPFKEIWMVIHVFEASIPILVQIGPLILTVKAISVGLTKDQTLGHIIQDQAYIKILVQEKFVGARVFSELATKHLVSSLSITWTDLTYSSIQRTGFTASAHPVPDRSATFTGVTWRCSQESLLEAVLIGAHTSQNVWSHCYLQTLNLI